MAYVQRFEDYNDGIEISEMLPSQDEDEILSPVAAAVVSRGVPSLHEYRYSGSYANKYQNQSSDPPGIYAENSTAESEISFGTEFDQVFDMEIGKVPSGKSWDDMRQILYIPSSNGGDDQSSSTEYSSIRRAGSSKCGRMRVYSNGEGSFLVPVDSDLDQVFEELSEQQATEEKIVSTIAAFQRRHNRSRSGSGVYSAPLYSLKENASLDDDQENDADKSRGSEEGSTRSESYYTKQNVYEDAGLLPSRSSPSPPPPPPPPPLTNTTRLNNHQFSHRKVFISGANYMSENDEHLASTRIPSTKNDDDTAMTSVLTQSTYSYPPQQVTIADIPSREHSEVELSVSPADILHDIGSFQRQQRLARQMAPDHSTPPRANRVGYDPFDGESTLESSFDPFGRQLRTIKRPAKPHRSLLSELMESATSVEPFSLPSAVETTSESRDDISCQRADTASRITRSIDSPSMKGITKLMDSIQSPDTIPMETTTKPPVAIQSEDTSNQKDIPKLDNLVDETMNDEDDSASSDDESSDANTNSITNGTDNTTIATVSERSNDEVRLRLDAAPETQVPSVLAVDAVLQEEFGIWADMEKWDEYPDDFALDHDIMNMRSPSGCVETNDFFKGQKGEEVDEILQNRDDDASKHTDTSSLSESTDASALSDDDTCSLGDKISVHNDEIDVQIASSKDESSEEATTRKTPLAPLEIESIENASGSNVVSNANDSTDVSFASDDTDPSFAFDGSEECDELLSLVSAASRQEAGDDKIDLFAKNGVLRAISAIADLHFSSWDDVMPEDDYQTYLELRYQRLLTQSISHTMLQSKVGGSQTIGLTLLLNGGDVNTSLWL